MYEPGRLVVLLILLMCLFFCCTWLILSGTLCRPPCRAFLSVKTLASQLRRNTRKPTIWVKELEQWWFRSYTICCKNSKKMQKMPLPKPLIIQFLPNSIHRKNRFLAHCVLAHVRNNRIPNNHRWVTSKPDDDLRNGHYGDTLCIGSQNKDLK